MANKTLKNSIKKMFSVVKVLYNALKKCKEIIFIFNNFGSHLIFNKI